MIHSRLTCVGLGLAAILCLVCSAAAAPPTEGLIFHADFDAGLDAALAKGNPKALVQGRRGGYLGEGKSGKAARVNGPTMELKYPLAGNLEAAKGTVAMFVKLDGATLTDPHTFIFFDAFKEKGYLVLNKLHSTPGLLQLVTIPEVKTPTGAVACRIENVDWKAGEWHHLTATWDENEIALFIDGKEAAVKQVEKPLAELGEFFFVGSSVNRWGNQPPKPVLLIDDLRIYNRVLSAEEITAVVENAAKGAEPAKKE